MKAGIIVLLMKDVYKVFCILEREAGDLLKNEKLPVFKVLVQTES